jgi:flagellar biosynthesis/type III secretory pathway chaperone
VDFPVNNTDSAAARLGELLAAELARIHDLEAALLAEHEALVGSDPDALEAATRTKNAAIAAQQEQQALRSAWLRSRGMDATASLDEAIHKIGGAARLNELHEAMVRHAERCQDRNRRNGALILRLQDRTREALNILRQGDAQPALYSTSGQRENSDDSRSLGKA